MFSASHFLGLGLGDANPLRILQRVFFDRDRAASVILVLYILGPISQRETRPIAVTQHSGVTQFDKALADSRHNDINTFAPPALDVITLPRATVLSKIVSSFFS